MLVNVASPALALTPLIARLLCSERTRTEVPGNVLIALLISIISWIFTEIILMCLREFWMQFYRRRNRGSGGLRALVRVLQLLPFQSKTTERERSEPIWEKDEEKGQVCPDLTSLPISRTKEPLKDPENQAAFAGVPAGFIEKGKLPCTEITLKPSFLGQFYFLSFSSFFCVCVFVSLLLWEFQTWLDHALDSSQPRAMVSITVILMTLQEHLKRINVFVLHWDNGK